MAGSRCQHSCDAIFGYTPENELVNKLRQHPTRWSPLSEMRWSIREPCLLSETAKAHKIWPGQLSRNVKHMTQDIDTLFCSFGDSDGTLILTLIRLIVWP